MTNNELERAWNEIELKQHDNAKHYQRLICSDLLYRIYIGVTGIPARRYIIFEIPKEEKEQFNAFVELRGFSLSLDNTIIKHDGFISCVIQSSSSDDNDVFTVVIADIIEELSFLQDAKQYVSSLRNRIETWRAFFKNNNRKQLSDSAVIGLFGELVFINQAIEAGLSHVVDLWNGPIKASQDFQDNRIAVEIKTVSSNALNYVHISSEMQLDNTNDDHLFLVAYRIERNDANGTKLPDLVEKINCAITDGQKNRFLAKLLCLGYDAQEARSQYGKGYALKESIAYHVGNGFPKVTKSCLPKGVDEVKYRLALQDCKPFEIDFSSIINTLRENG